MMARDEMKEALGKLLTKVEPPYDRPSSKDWADLERRMCTNFGREFITLIDLLSDFDLRGETLNVVTAGRTNGNPSIAFVYEHECAHGEWPRDMIPFYAVGNGDYYCLSAREGCVSCVYYVSHDDGRTELVAKGVGDWICHLAVALM